jgi:hypothetical protein
MIKITQGQLAWYWEVDEMHHHTRTAIVFLNREGIYYNFRVGNRNKKIKLLENEFVVMD